MRNFLFAGILLVLAHAQTSRAEEPATPAKPAVAPAAAKALTDQPDAATKNSAPAQSKNNPAVERAQEQDKMLRAMGYRPVERDGATLYCRKQAVLGSRFEKMVCGTADDLERAAQNAKDATDKMLQQSLHQLPSG